MSQEILKPEQLQTAIGQINEITQIATRAQELRPFNYEEKIAANTVYTSGEFNADTPLGVFWNNPIKKLIALAAMAFENSDLSEKHVDAVFVDACQRNAVDMISARLNGSSQALAELERATLDSCLDAFRSFSWAENPGLFEELKTSVKKLANLYAAYR